ncbi:hypothetical protein BB558_006996 [Smittium angustum]|uniref:BRCT domain-containing protein n=1 Tax=Smittium angustum TaxID=133377 RepID=A0A2U1IW81_SMIAN|nr:hypothetical protein BB558_006996 [Smittium angustum]
MNILKPPKIFASDPKNPLLFSVQAVRNPSLIKNLIEFNGGIIVSDNYKSDKVIKLADVSPLKDSKSVYYDKQYIYDCCKSGSILNLDNYHLKPLSESLNSYENSSSKDLKPKKISKTFTPDYKKTVSKEFNSTQSKKRSFGKVEGPLNLYSNISKDSKDNLNIDIIDYPFNPNKKAKYNIPVLKSNSFDGDHSNTNGSPQISDRFSLNMKSNSTANAPTFTIKQEHSSDTSSILEADDAFSESILSSKSVLLVEDKLANIKFEKTESNTSQDESDNSFKLLKSLVDGEQDMSSDIYNDDLYSKQILITQEFSVPQAEDASPKESSLGNIKKNISNDFDDISPTKDDIHQVLESKNVLETNNDKESEIDTNMKINHKTNKSGDSKQDTQFIQKSNVNNVIKKSIQKVEYESNFDNLPPSSFPFVEIDKSQLKSLVDQTSETNASQSSRGDIKSTSRFEENRDNDNLSSSKESNQIKDSKEKNISGNIINGIENTHEFSINPKINSSFTEVTDEIDTDIENTPENEKDKDVEFLDEANSIEKKIDLLDNIQVNNTDNETKLNNIILDVNNPPVVKEYNDVGLSDCEKSNRNNKKQKDHGSNNPRATRDSSTVFVKISPTPKNSLYFLSDNNDNFSDTLSSSNLLVDSQLINKLNLSAKKSQNTSNEPFSSPSHRKNDSVVLKTNKNPQKGSKNTKSHKPKSLTTKELTRNEPLVSSKLDKQTEKARENTRGVNILADYDDEDVDRLGDIDQVLRSPTITENYQSKEQDRNESKGLFKQYISELANFMGIPTAKVVSVLHSCSGNWYTAWEFIKLQYVNFTEQNEENSFTNFLKRETPNILNIWQSEDFDINLENFENLGERERQFQKILKYYWTSDQDEILFQYSDESALESLVRLKGLEEVIAREKIVF